MARPLKPNPIGSKLSINILSDGRVDAQYIRRPAGRLTRQSIDELWNWLQQRRAGAAALSRTKVEREYSRIRFEQRFSDIVTLESYLELILSLGFAYTAATGARPTTTNTLVDRDECVHEGRTGLFVDFVREVLRRANPDGELPSGGMIHGMIERLGPPQGTKLSRRDMEAEREAIWGESAPDDRFGDDLLQRISDLFSDTDPTQASKELARDLEVSLPTLRQWLRVAQLLSDILMCGVDDLLKELVLDIRRIFHAHDAIFLSTHTILQNLAAMPDRPWVAWKKSRPLARRELASLLKPLGIRPKPRRIGGAHQRGYLRMDFVNG